MGRFVSGVHSYRDEPSSPNLAPMRDNSNDGSTPRRSFQSSSSTDRLMVNVMESSDLTPPATSNGFHSSNGGQNTSENNGDGGGSYNGMMMMEPSDSTPGAISKNANTGMDNEVLDLDQIEI